MNKTIIIILPLPHKSEIENYVIPLELFPDGIKDIATCALVNLDNFDSFYDDCLTMIEVFIDEMEDVQVAERYAALWSSEQYALFLEISLHNFFDDFLEIVRSIVGPHIDVELVRIISYRTIGSICVELNHEPHSKISGH